LVRNAWVAFLPPHYGQRSRAYVGCVTFHDLVYDMPGGSIDAYEQRGSLH
jgi:hypothetical protein